MVQSDLSSLHVNREQEVALFLDILQGARRAHILLIKAAGGMGKSSLLREFWKQSRDIQRALIDLKGLVESWVVLGKLADRLGREHFERFDDKLAEFAGAGKVTLDRTTLVATHVEASFGPIDPTQHKMRRQMLTKAFFQDLEALHARSRQQALFLFDTFDQANPEVQDWLGGSFLDWIRRYRWLVTVIAGRSIPEPDISWEELCLRHTLHRLERSHVREYLRRVELSLSEEEIGIVYDISDGNPLDLATYIGRLLAKRSVPHG